MSQEGAGPDHGLIPAQPIPEGTEDFRRRVHGLLDGKPKDEATVARELGGMDGVFDSIAAGMYSLASMLVGEGEESIRLVETAVANAEVSACDDTLRARRSSRRALCEAALKTIEEREPGSLAAPEGFSPPSTCIDKEDLESAGLAQEVLERMMHGPDREQPRKWLESLPALPRTVFVLRAVAGFSSAETAALLARNGGTRAAGWTAGAVSEVFRQGLCSLASQLFQDSAKG